MSRTKTLATSVIVITIQQLINIIYGLIIPRLVISTYGSEINGLTASISQLLAYFATVEAGIANAAIYALYKPLAENDNKKISGIVVATQKFYYQSGCIFTILTVAAAIIYPILKSTPISPLNTFFLVLILGAGNFANFFVLAKYRALLTASQKSYVISFISSVLQVIALACMLVLVFIRVNIAVIYSIQVILLFPNAIALHVYVKKRFNIDFNAQPDKAALSKRWDAFYLQFLASAQISAPIIILTIFCELTIISIYSIHNMVLISLNAVIGAFSVVMPAMFGEIIARNEMRLLKKSYTEFCVIFYAIISVLFGITTVMLVPFIQIYTQNITDIDYTHPLFAFLVAFNGFMYHIKTPQGALVISAGHYKETRWRSTIQGLIIIVLGLVLTPLYGLIGIAIAVLLSNIYRTIDLLFYVPRKITKTSVFKTALLMLWAFILFAIIVSVGFLISLPCNTILQWSFKSFVYIISSIIIALIFMYIFYKEELYSSISRLKGMIKK